MTAPRPFAEVLAELTRLDAAATPGPITIKDETNLIASDGYGLTSLSGNVGDPRSRNMANAAKAAAAWNALPALLARAAVFEAAVALIAAEDMPPHTPFDGNSPEWDTKFDAEHKANLALREAVRSALAAESHPRAERGEETK